MTIDILSDHAYQDDALNFTQYANVFSNIITNTTTLPFTVGIFRKSTQMTCPDTKEVEQLMQLTVMAK